MSAPTHTDVARNEATARLVALGGAAPDMADIPRRQPPADSPIEVRMCEVSRTTLRPRQLYSFSIDPNCEACRAASGRALAEQAPPAAGVDPTVLSALEAAARARPPDTCDVCEIQPCTNCANIGVARERALAALAKLVPGRGAG